MSEQNTTPAAQTPMPDAEALAREAEQIARQKAMETAPVVIEARGVGKRYEMHRHRSMLLQDTAKIAFSKVEKNYFWALRDVNFQIRKGESVALIGPNGAGKSTLLSLIAKTVHPTEGKIDVKGRVSALLELGAGFHPYFTGRENIFINGIVMGLSRAQIEARMPEIIAFSELEPFIDEPIQNYSSGMLARLGFSVAASFDPEILIVDEALSVGDAAFQEKSFKRIQEFKKQGCTILFVTHSLDLVTKFCDRALLIAQGQVLESGPSEEICESYKARMEAGTLQGARSPHETVLMPFWKRAVAMGVLAAGLGVVAATGIHFVLGNTAGMEKPAAAKRFEQGQKANP